MFRRILISILLLCTLGYGSVWAYDSHASALPEAPPSHAHETAVSASTDHAQPGQHQQHEQHKHDGDHCCHASAHILALLPAGDTRHSPQSSLPVATYLASLPARALSPLERPPRR